MKKNETEDKMVEIMKMVEIRTYVQQIAELIDTLDYMLENVVNKKTSDICDSLNKEDSSDENIVMTCDSVIMVDPNGQARIVSSNIEDTDKIYSATMLQFLAELLTS
ncbi:hypothetical protein HB943_11595 [Listeria weihenstephanensis]|uniref:Uncharacterized protein n=1 Tax=Listeria weihenstephanensis TaxID=1006155 RepID=A0A841Z9V1_9LIST|nr:hypothetical protein [Listeria weihenstephanensis]MBC1501247.1 hypothetical protein [Listeria weihenstephanensis]